MNEQSETIPHIVVYSEQESESIVKKLWQYLSGEPIRIKTVTSRESLRREAPDALLILIILHDSEASDSRIPDLLREMPDVVCNVIALARNSKQGQRIDILAKGYEAVYDIDFLANPAFQRILRNNVEKGRIQIKNRILRDEYMAIKAALAASAAAFIVFDGNRKLSFVSEHYLKAYPSWGHRLVKGISVMEAYKIYCKEEGFTPDHPHYNTLTRFWQKLEGEEDYFAPDGRIFRLRARKLPDDKGTIVITTNITTHIRQAEALEEKSAALEESLRKEKEASEIQKQFINMVSHEFRTPLSIIDGHAQVFQRRGSDLSQDSLGKRARIIRSAVARLVMLMEGVLSSNMLKTGALELVREPVDLRELIDDLCENHEMLSKKGQINTAYILESPKLNLDKKVITLVVSNLLSNALKFSPETGVVSVKVTESSDSIKVEVSDDGIGIPKKDLERVFSRYYRAATASGIPGTGIGLNLVQDLINLHGGKISIQSEVDVGTTVSFQLPLAD